jgi:hypothetical protein
LLTTKDMKKMEWFKTGEDFEILGDKVWQYGLSLVQLHWEILMEMFMKHHTQ